MAATHGERDCVELAAHTSGPPKLLLTPAHSVTLAAEDCIVKRSASLLLDGAAAAIEGGAAGCSARVAAPSGEDDWMELVGGGTSDSPRPLLISGNTAIGEGDIEKLHLDEADPSTMDAAASCSGCAVRLSSREDGACGWTELAAGI